MTDPPLAGMLIVVALFAPAGVAAVIGTLLALRDRPRPVRFDPSRAARPHD